MNTSFCSDHSTGPVMDVSALSKGKRIVHLDLKGAPPRMNYLCEVQTIQIFCYLYTLLDLSPALQIWPLSSLPQLIQLFADLGAKGILIEYEDTFPYEGELKILQSKSHPAYRCKDYLLYALPKTAVENMSHFMCLMFVWSHCHCSTYSCDEIITIQDVAYSRGLEIIPLVQTFGHLEVSERGE